MIVDCSGQVSSYSGTSTEYTFTQFVERKHTGSAICKDSGLSCGLNNMIGKMSESYCYC